MSKNGYAIMDCDLHLLEPADLYEKRLEQEFRNRAPIRCDNNANGLGSIWHVDGRPYPAPARSRRRYAQLWRQKTRSPEHMAAASRQFDAVATLQAMDIEGVDLAALYRSGGGLLPLAIEDIEPEFAIALARAFNNWLADFCSEDPSRLKGVAVIPLKDIDLAVKETRRAVEELGFVGITLYPEKVSGRLPYDREVDPLWAEAQALNIAVGIHGSSTGLAKHDFSRKFSDHPAGGTLTHALSFPVQNLTVMGGMIVSGVFERFPKLRVGYLESNCSWLPWWLYRMDDQWEKYGPAEEGDILSMRPSEYFRRNCYVSLDPDERTVRHVIEEVGDENILFSTDFPHSDSAFPNATNIFLEMTDLSSASKRKILWDNCRRFYGYDPEAPGKDA
jgi:predicted TIM-barrel fold metal-dependent hydrolase